jgi:hypothetical protein
MFLIGRRESAPRLTKFEPMNGTPQRQGGVTRR